MNLRCFREEVAVTRAIFVPVLAVLVAVTTSANAQIVGSGHDFSNEAWSQGRICFPCHATHNAQTDDDGSSLALWNHEMTDESFTMYGGFAMDRADRDQDEQPGGPSKLCLSCHDGVTAVDAFGGGPEAPSMLVEETSSLGTDLRDDHPIGIQYPADGTEGYKPKANLQPLKLLEWGGRSDRVECTSCHDAHDDSVGDFLRMDNTNSALCLQCHDR